MIAKQEDFIRKLIREELNKLNKKIYHGGILSEHETFEDFLETYGVSKEDTEQIFSIIKKEISSKYQDGFYWFSDNINVAEYFSNLKYDENGYGLKFIAICNSHTKNTLNISNNELNKLGEKYQVEHNAELAPIIANETNFDSWETMMRGDGDLYNDICIFDESLFIIEKILFEDENGNYSIEIY